MPELRPDAVKCFCRAPPCASASGGVGLVRLPIGSGSALLRHICRTGYTPTGHRDHKYPAIPQGMHAQHAGQSARRFDAGTTPSAGGWTKPRTRVRARRLHSRIQANLRSSQRRPASPAPARHGGSSLPRDSPCTPHPLQLQVQITYGRGIRATRCTKEDRYDGNHARHEADRHERPDRRHRPSP